jgi:hypothetical protein
MSISEDQLETWSHLGQTGQFMATYQTIKAVLDDHRAPYANREADSFLQGSYKNDTNVHGDSDVDIVLRTKAVYYSDTGRLKPDERRSLIKAGRGPRTNCQISKMRSSIGSGSIMGALLSWGQRP